MENQERLGIIFKELANELNISDTLYERAVQSYSALGKYIKENNKDWDVEVFPQGSFELGTVIKPVNNDDQYDVDLVVLVNSPDFSSPLELRKSIQCFLENHGRYEDRIQEKKQCLRVIYSDNSQFHMDVVCSVPSEFNNEKIINVAKKKEDGTGYEYAGSNPKGYIEWFKKTMAYERLLQEARFSATTDIQSLSLQRMKTPLQQAIQILKRHRDLFFQNDLDNRPSSIIITTLCALAYDNAKLFESVNNNVYLAIKEMLSKFYLFMSPNSNSEYKLENPSYTDENFLHKWNYNEKLKENFDKWIEKARQDIIINPLDFIESDQTQMRESLFESFGQKPVSSALEKYGQILGLKKDRGEIFIDKNTMSIAEVKPIEIIIPKKNTFYGDK